jgi:hypothetical protein
MMVKYEVRVAPDFRWNLAQIAGRRFSKSEVTTLAEHEMSKELRRAAEPEYGILEIVEVKPQKVQKKKGGGDG